MPVKTTRLTEREARILHAVQRALAYWTQEVLDRNFAGRNEAERDLCVAAGDQLAEIEALFTEE